jgi:hypothetical protein
VDYVIHTPTEFQTTIQTMEKQLPLKFQTLDQKTAYALDKMVAVYNKDREQKFKIKKWIRNTFDE